MKQEKKRSEREMMEDSLRTQKKIATDYNDFAFSCTGEGFRNTLLTILEDEHNICATVQEEMASRGWQKSSPAKQTEILKTKQKFSVPTN